MEEILKQKCDLILTNREIYKKRMVWEIDRNSCAIMAAMISAASGKTADENKYKECKKILRDRASAFSQFRGIARPMVIAKMTLADNPIEYIDGAMTVYKKLRSIHKLTASPFMVMAALTIYENGGLENADANIEKLESLYKTLKKAHPFLINDYDRGYLSMLVAFGMDLDRIPEEIEQCYSACKKISIGKDAVHSLAQVLSLCDKSPEEKAANVTEEIALLRSYGKPISKSYGLAALGALELLNIPIEEKVKKIDEVDEYLKGKKGFKWYNHGGRIRRMYASLIVLMAYADEDSSKLATNISSTLVMTLVEELIIMLIIASTSASAAASSSSGS